ncbi:MAG TPA: glycosyltransferase [Candidatus Limiplasma sp.]|nr:glycosyltransferase [Candidatus Limiplasma sp.]
MSKISIVIPCRNEVLNVEPISEAVTKLLENYTQYTYEILFIDNCSNDGTQDRLRIIAKKDKRIKVILNGKNFPNTSALHALYEASGDCVIMIPADFQVPVSLVGDMIDAWENGAMVVAPIKQNSKSDKIRVLRKIYYWMSSKLSEQDTLPGFTGAAMYTRQFLDICKATGDPLISMQDMVIRYADPIVKLHYLEQPRRSGKSKSGAGYLIDTAINRFIGVSNVLPKYAVTTGLGMGLISLIIALYYLVRKLIDWYNFPVGIAPILIGMFLLGSIQLIFIGTLSAYILMINERQMKKPLVIERERINFDTEDEKEENK